MKLKDPQESCGKSKSASIAAPEAVSEPSIVVDVSAIGIPRTEPEDNAFKGKLCHGTSTYS